MNKKKRNKNETFASKVTTTIASWWFIGLFLCLCFLEIWYNHSSLIPALLKFDPDTIKLNLILSLIAAVQGSIIMIDQRQADKIRDELIQKTFKLEEKQVKTDKEIVILLKNLVEKDNKE